MDASCELFAGRMRSSRVRAEDVIRKLRTFGLENVKLLEQWRMSRVFCFESPVIGF